MCCVFPLPSGTGGLLQASAQLLSKPAQSGNVFSFVHCMYVPIAVCVTVYASHVVKAAHQGH